MLALVAAASDSATDVLSGPYGCRECKPHVGPSRSEQQQHDAVHRISHQQSQRESLVEGFEQAVPPGWVAVRNSAALGYSGVFQGR
jgi:hypothetical protein